ncbi:MAG: type II toxin-antitoxin system RelE/ParE family toxin [Prevotella sp.]|nr:type II toxin-antitoxin system RelE/ParE family toxin [Prevotella sp.]
MIQEIRFSDEFNRAFKRLKKRYRSLPADLKQLLASLVANPKQGKELYNGMRKIRVSFTSKSKGKRGGGRVIIRLAVNETSLTFVYIYDKSDFDNVSDEFLDQIIVDVGQGKYTSLSIGTPEA